MSYYLYYAGMAADGFTEQIGLAISDDGWEYTRAGQDGLIIPVDPSKPWKSLRTCNPTVLQGAEKFLMFYQGIAQDGRTSIGVATSIDGLTWDCIDNPSMTVESEYDALQCGMYGTTDLIEPAVIREDGRYRMWLVTRGLKEPGNRIHHASSEDGLFWKVDRAGLVEGTFFGVGCKVHYPQVTLTKNGYCLYVSVRQPNGRFSVHYSYSTDGYCFNKWTVIKSTVVLPLFLLRILNKLRLSACPFSHGLAHSHVVDGDEIGRTYYHAYHLTRNRRTFMNIVAIDSTHPNRIITVLDVPRNIAAWDYYFVADPFIMKLQI